MTRCASSAAFAVTLLCTTASLAQPAQTFTRKQVLSLSPQELAARVLAAVAAKGTAKEHKVYISPVMPTPPWLETVLIDMPVTQENHLCSKPTLAVRFEPLDPEEAKKHLFDAPSSYDPPTQVRSVDLATRYADSANETDAACAALSDEKYFNAPDRFSALQAIDAFKLFRAESANPKSATQFTCADLPGDGACKAGWQKTATVFYDVISIQQETDKNAVHTRTLVLSPKPLDASSADELWLTVRFDEKGMHLTKAQYVVQWPPPVL